MVGHPPGAFPLGEAPPVGARQGMGEHGCWASGRRPWICLRKGSGRQYQPRSWSQRYYRDPEWQRQARRRRAARLSPERTECIDRFHRLDSTPRWDGWMITRVFVRSGPGSFINTL